MNFPVLFAKILVAVCLLLGIIGTCIHRLPGTPLIFFAALLYGLVFGRFMGTGVTWLAALAVLMLTAELGSRYLPRVLAPYVGISKVFGLDVAAGSFASLVVTDVLLGPVLGLFTWELFMGKSLMPLIKRSGLLVLELFAAALFRFIIAVVMIVIVVFRVL